MQAFWIVRLTFNRNSDRSCLSHAQQNTYKRDRINTLRLIFNHIDNVL